MDELIKELEKIFRFKATTNPGDIVLIVTENPQALVYALVVGIERDRAKKDEWWHVSFQILSFPPEKATWILRTPQFTGKETFTMGGNMRYVKALDFSDPEKEKGQGKIKPKKTVLRVVK